MKKIGFIFFILLLPLQIFAQLFPDLGGQRTGISSAQFLKIGIGSRALGMGASYVAVANDAEALYWNPAGISQFSKPALFFSHTEWLVDVKLEYAGAVYHLNSVNSIGAAITFLHTDEMKETTVFQPFGTGRYFNFSDFLVALSYARNMTEKFSFGLSVKFMQENLAELTMRSVLFDLGTYYKTGWKSIRFAVAVSNFGADMKPSGTIENTNLNNENIEISSFQSFSPPTVFRIGLAWEILDNEKHKVTNSVQLNHPNDNRENINLGLEYWWNDLFALRGGYVTARTEEDFSVGFGIHAPITMADFRLDYAFSNFGRLGNVNRFSLQLLF
jgi:long-subunit fatty acid transport protein